MLLLKTKMNRSMRIFTLKNNWGYPKKSSSPRSRTEKWVGPTYFKKLPKRSAVPMPAVEADVTVMDDIFKGPEWTEGEDGKMWFNPSTSSDVVEEVESPYKWWNVEPSARVELEKASTASGGSATVASGTVTPTSVDDTTEVRRELLAKSMVARACRRLGSAPMEESVADLPMPDLDKYEQQINAVERVRNQLEINVFNGRELAKREEVKRKNGASDIASVPKSELDEKACYAGMAVHSAEPRILAATDLREDDTLRFGKSIKTGHREKTSALRALPFSLLVARPVPRNEFLGNKDAMVAYWKEWKKLEDKKTWQWSTLYYQNGQTLLNVRRTIPKMSGVANATSGICSVVWTKKVRSFPQGTPGGTLSTGSFFRAIK